MPAVPWQWSGGKFIAPAKSGPKTGFANFTRWGMNVDEEREELRKKIEALNNLGALINRVQAHAKYLSSIPVNERSDLQKIWVLADEATELKMAPGTEETLFEAALNLEALDNTIQQTIKQYPTSQNERSRFSFFGRR
jgi:hypothetical protein